MASLLLDKCCRCLHGFAEGEIYSECCDCDGQMHHECTYEESLQCEWEAWDDCGRDPGCRRCGSRDAGSAIGADSTRSDSSQPQPQLQALPQSPMIKTPPQAPPSRQTTQQPPPLDGCVPHRSARYKVLPRVAKLSGWPHSSHRRQPSA